jgi:hypothetical protein
MADKTYVIHVTTGDDPVAGTDSNIYMELIGEQGRSGEFALGGDLFAFETGQTDRFEVTLPDLGDIRQVCLRHDASADPGWYVETVGVEDNAGGIWSFTFERWLDSEEHGGVLEACADADE